MILNTQNSIGDSAIFYDEDTWSTRLFHSLKSFFLKVFTAHLRGYGTRDLILTSVPLYIPFLFRGAPDFVVKQRSALTAVLAKELKLGDASCGDEGRVEVGFQMQPLKPYKQNSQVPEKIWALVAAVHQYIVSKTIRRTLKGKAVETVNGHGLFIEKTTGVHHVQVSLSFLLQWEAFQAWK